MGFKPVEQGEGWSREFVWPQVTSKEEAANSRQTSQAKGEGEGRSQETEGRLTEAER